MGRALILGAAKCVWKDLDRALDMSEFDAVYAVKVAGVYFSGRVDSWVGLHPEYFNDHIKKRAANGFEPAGDICTYRDEIGTNSRSWRGRDWYLPGQIGSGSSGFFAVFAALHDGFSRVVLCGVPLTREEGRVDGRVWWESSTHYQNNLLPALPGIRDRVRSMSGWTREQLGAPTAEWLNSHEVVQDAPTSGTDEERSTSCLA